MAFDQLVNEIILSASHAGIKMNQLVRPDVLGKTYSVRYSFIPNVVYLLLKCIWLIDGLGTALPLITCLKSETEESINGIPRVA